MEKINKEYSNEFIFTLEFRGKAIETTVITDPKTGKPVEKTLYETVTIKSTNFKKFPPLNVWKKTDLYKYTEYLVKNLNILSNLDNVQNEKKVRKNIRADLRKITTWCGLSDRQDERLNEQIIRAVSLKVNKNGDISSSTIRQIVTTIYTICNKFRIDEKAIANNSDELAMILDIEHQTKKTVSKKTAKKAVEKVAETA